MRAFRESGRNMEILMPKAEWGVKRICTSCGVRFYDLLRDPVVCPGCGAVVDVTVVVKPKRVKPGATQKAAVKPVLDDEDADLIEDEDDHDENEDDEAVEDTPIVIATDDDDDEDEDEPEVEVDDDDDDIKDFEDDVLLEEGEDELDDLDDVAADGIKKL